MKNSAPQLSMTPQLKHKLPTN